MSITKPTLKTSYGGKRDNVDKFTATLWDNALNALDTKLGEIIDALDGSGSSSASGDFYVNGVKTTATNGKITLAAFGGTGYPDGGYVLKGTLNGQIIIGAETDSPTDDTIIELAGVNITTASTDNAAIMYMPGDQSVRMTIAKNTENIIRCTNSAAQADSQKGVIWSENNLILQGAGYLALENKGGHGIKCKQVRLMGNPHIFVRANHDGIHGNQAVDIYGGVYYFDGNNKAMVDAFGTRAASGTVGSADYKSPGAIRVFKAKIYAFGLEQNVLDSKAAGYIFGDNLTIMTDAAVADVLSGMTWADTKVYFGGAVQDATNGGYTTQPSGSVKCYTDKDMTTGETTISAVNGVYTLTTKYVKVSGYIAGKLTTAVETTDITATDNTYIEGNIEYTATKKKLGVQVESDKILMVGGSITSASNLYLEFKAGSAFVVGGIETGDLTFNNSKGVFVCKGDVTAKIVYSGTDEDTYGATSKADPSKKIYGAIVVEGEMNIGINSKFKKGHLIVRNAGMVGGLYVDTLNQQRPSPVADNNHVYYHTAKGVVIGDKTIEDKDYITI